MTHRPDSEIIEKTHNTARFFTEWRHISWVVLAGVIAWGVFGYVKMPKRKDPEVPVRIAAALTPWPGASAEKIEQLVTRRIEERIAANTKIRKIESISRTNVSVVFVELDEGLADTSDVLDDIKLRLDAIHDLPEGAGPINFVKDYGDTAALMLTVASPPADAMEIELRAREIRAAIEKVRRGEPGRLTLVAAVPRSVSAAAIESRLRDLARFAERDGIARDVRTITGGSFVALDVVTDLTPGQLIAAGLRLNRERFRADEMHPDVWPPVVIRDPAETQGVLAANPGAKYSYRELERYTDLIKRELLRVPEVSKVERSGILEERVFLDYSQERIAAYGISGSNFRDILSARNVTLPGGIIQAGGRNVRIDPSGEFRSEKEIGDVIVGASKSGTPVYLRDLVNINRVYETPARFLNFYTYRDARGEWHRARAITLGVQMKSGHQIAAFGEHVGASLADLQVRLPHDLIVVRTSDQPLQVEENLDLFMKSLYEAIALVVLVALIGFWEWRSAMLMALSIPLTLAMTFGMMVTLGVDLQQVSIASLIIALGLLVDDPVVAGDAIKRELGSGRPPLIAAWLGPTKLATAILFATITNIVAYLPLLLLDGDTGRFLYTLPVVLTCALVASRIVSMTFVPLLGYFLLRPKKEEESARANRRGFASAYYRFGSWALRHRWAVLGIASVFLLIGGAASRTLKQSFFPKDYSYLSYVDVWLPEDASLTATNETAQKVEGIVRDVTARYGGKREVLERVTSFIGGGGPRFWFSVAPELQQLNYAQVVIQVRDKHDTAHLVPLLQRELSSSIPGARIDVRQLETGPPVGVPVAVRISGEDMAVLRAEAEKVKTVFRSIPIAERIRDDWGAETFVAKLQVDPDRANLAGVSNLDVALSSVAAMNGLPVTTLRDGEDQIPVLFRLRAEERGELSDVQNLYVSSHQGPQKVPLGQISKITYAFEAEKLRRRNQFRTITVSAFPADGKLPAEVMSAARAKLDALAKDLPPGYRLEIGGEEEEQVKGFRQMSVVMLISIACIFFALVVQFRNAVKPLIVFAAIPFGVVGALITLAIAGAPFGFMAFLGVASLIGVIVSHVIVLFDFIEEAHERGEPLEQALLDAGIVRLRPVLVTVGATVLGLFPLASHGGPLWEGLCYAQIGGLTIATVVTLVLVPVIYAIFVRDLKLVEWEEGSRREEPMAIEVVPATA